MLHNFVHHVPLDANNATQTPNAQVVIQDTTWKLITYAIPVVLTAKHVRHKLPVYLVEMGWYYLEPAVFHAILMIVYIALKIQINKYNVLSVQ